MFVTYGNLHTGVIFTKECHNDEGIYIFRTTMSSKIYGIVLAELVFDVPYERNQ